jgi:hypothetical protein
MLLLSLWLTSVGIIVDGLTVALVDKLLVDNIAIRNYYGSDVSVDEGLGVIGSLGNNNYAGLPILMRLE